MKAKILIMLSLCFALLLNSNCKQTYTCTDGQQNQGETGIDCGDAAGLCPPCNTTGTPTATCTDGIQNGTETGVDCGGTCPACDTTVEPPVTTDPNMSANVNGSAWEATGAGIDSYGSLSIVGLGVTAAGDSVTIAISYAGDYLVGTYDFADIGVGAVIAINDVTAECASTIGTLAFNTFDTINQQVSGTFTFTCLDADGNSLHTVDSGTFTSVPYTE